MAGGGERTMKKAKRAEFRREINHAHFQLLHLRRPRDAREIIDLLSESARLGLAISDAVGGLHPEDAIRELHHAIKAARRTHKRSAKRTRRRWAAVAHLYPGYRLSTRVYPRGCIHEKKI